MGKRGIFLFCIFVLLILVPNAFSIYEELLFSDIVEDRDALNISGKEFRFMIDSQSKKVIIEIDVSGIIVDNGDCKIKDNLHICINNVSFSYRNYDPWYDVYKAEVKVYQIKAKLDVMHTIEKENILIDEETTATLAFENTADVPAENVTATLPIPKNLEIVEIEGCKKTLDSISFNGNVNPTQVRTCSYKVRGAYAGDYELKANISYFDGVDNKNTVSGALKGKVYNYSLVISNGINKSTFDIGENFNMSIVLENINDEYDLSVTALSIKMPEKILIVKKPKELKGTGRLLSWSGTLKPKEKKSLDLELEGLITGNHTFAATGSYKVYKFFRKAEKRFGINIDCNCPHIEHDFSQNIVVGGQRAVLIADLVNPGHNEFKNVKISYVTAVPGIEPKSTTYGSIKAGERIRVFDSSVIAPDLGELYYFNITAVYESFANEVFVKRKSIPIGVKIVENVEAVAKKEEESQQQSEEQIEVKKEENISLVSGTIEGSKEEKEKEGKGKTGADSKEISLTTIGIERKVPLMAFTIIAFIMGLIFFTVFLVRLKSRGNMDEAREPEAMGEEREQEKQKIKGFLLSIVTKKEAKEPKSEQQAKEEMEYEGLAKQVRQLGKTFEEEQEAKKKGFLGRVFRK